MCKTIIVTVNGHVHGVHDWTGGFKPLKCPRRRLSEQDMLARASYLERRERYEEAYDLLLRFLAGHCIEWNTE